MDEARGDDDRAMYMPYGVEWAFALRQRAETEEFPASFFCSARWDARQIEPSQVSETVRYENVILFRFYYFLLLFF
jgi:hypothetical protein